MPHGDAAGDLADVLAARLPLLGLILVPRTRRARVLWHDGPPVETELEALAALGRDHLAADIPASPYLDGAAWAFTVREHSGTPTAVVFAVRHGGAWTPEERSILNHSFLLVQNDLLALAGRPRPERGDDLGPDLETRMRAAVDRDELVLLYQPEVDLRTGRILAVEALLRWDHPELGRLEPQSFIPLAERSDLIKLLGTWVIDRALADFARWGDPSLVLRINVSPAQLTGDGVVDRLAGALAEHGVPGSQVCVEFTETVSDTDVLMLSATVPALRALGVSSALDDLASGYSTLSRLRSLEVDVVKIDRSLVVGIDVDQRAATIVRFVFALAAELGIEVVAEGIETPAEADALIGLGCVRGQGHHFGRPQHAAAIAQLLGSTTRR
ncbi:EAL domain-containing protein [Jatrophihabitans endophyticus]|uniref:EAL domain-containing protein n=1 Tax=Jatrophihabitans endophyticus TaxID=1206085 RepID=UPI0019DF47AC|nr:EAL domain-containing protein [Jatrophihabitans endophyticus]MBE7188417.1 EAL domain-containing protein [Jatrophihabitans endophyticus]